MASRTEPWPICATSHVVLDETVPIPDEPDERRARRNALAPPLTPELKPRTDPTCHTPASTREISSTPRFPAYTSSARRATTVLSPLWPKS
ncbi:hypothetical protein [Verrucosispora sp. WMMD573]|uniref:hypothetical protein n=1 Tax=Verrucosispora sp. WMMD573 TaxID=3015149 RepID=UPI00248D0FC8|nr:hypothetical protein [Verrucosispora sp. WMMD573]WBB56314.1 hypothetical protein O7601_09680 [Verrucosispora sp. WMMD573]